MHELDLIRQKFDIWISVSPFSRIMQQDQLNVFQKCGSQFRRRISVELNLLNWIWHGRNVMCEPGLSDHPKCQSFLVTYRKWSLTRAYTILGKNFASVAYNYRDLSYVFNVSFYEKSFWRQNKACNKCIYRTLQLQTRTKNSGALSWKPVSTKDAGIRNVSGKVLSG